jgi:putative Ca2+/H+ antiporter (TMEM165/GDT1 family)
MDITPFLTTFSLIALAEFGDKTQFAVIALSAKYHRVKVFTGVILAFALVTALGVLVGDVIFIFIPQNVIRILAGLLLVVFGIITLSSKESCETDEAAPIVNPLFSAFSMIALGLISLIGIFLGKKLCKIVPLPKIKLGAGVLFILFGIMFLAGL